MQRSTAKRRVAATAPQPAIAFGAGAAADEPARFGRRLTVLMRSIAVVWLLQGVLQWVSVLATGRDGLSPFMALTPGAMTAAVFFAVADFVAAVGLWLVAPWGGIIWLVTVGAQLVALYAMPGFFAYPLALAPADVALSAVYLALLWFASREPVAGR